jgi:hypothetical protein
MQIFALIAFLFASEDYSKLLDFNYLPQKGTLIFNSRLVALYSSEDDDFSMQTAIEEILISLSSSVQLGFDFKYIFSENTHVFRERVKEMVVRLNLLPVRSDNLALIFNGFYGFNSEIYSRAGSDGVSLDKKEMGVDLKLASARDVLGLTFTRSGSSNNLNIALYFYHRLIKQRFLDIAVGLYANTDRVRESDVYQNTTISPYGSITLLFLPNVFLEIDTRPMMWEIQKVNGDYEVEDIFDKLQIPLNAQLTVAF